MNRCFILCQNPALAAGLRNWLVSKGHVDEQSVVVKTVEGNPDPVDVAFFFDRLADWMDLELEANSGGAGIPSVIMLTDLCGYGRFEYARLSPVRPYGGWAAVLGMLVLAYPEVHWVFTSKQPYDAQGESQGPAAGPSNELRDARPPENLAGDFSAIFRQRLTPLCDGFGLRDRIREVMSQDDGAHKLPRRGPLAVAIDEERSYAWLHAYTAYRFGYRAQAVTTYAGMKSILSEHGSQPELIFEDYFLQFADGNPLGLSNLRTRDQTPGLERLAKAAYRILVTSGHHRGQDPEARTANPAYLRELRSSNRQWNRELNKPLGGIFNLWIESGLQGKLRGGGRRGLAAGFHWPNEQSEREGGHSAPGRLLIIADRLIARAERLLPEVKSVPQAVRGALLATDAMELIGGKTPTTSLEALALKQYFEVLAECQFVGTRQHMDVRTRVKDIQREVQALSGWFGAGKRQRLAAAWNAELSILNKLIAVFRDHNHFDEEQILQVRARKLHRKLRFVNYPAFLKPLEIFPWYVEKLVTSFPLFLAAIAVWIVVLGGLYSWAGDVSMSRGLADAYNGFIGIGPPNDDKLWKAEHGWNGPFYLVAFTLALGFVHLGIFISHLYSLISRK